MNLLYCAIVYGDNFLTFNDAFLLYFISKECKKLSVNYLNNYNMFTIYPGTSKYPSTKDAKKKYLIKKLNHKKIKILNIMGCFNGDGILVKFALQCKNVRSLYLIFIYPYISNILSNLNHLESIYLKKELRYNDYITLIKLPSIKTILFTVTDSQKIEEKSKEITTVIYHKTRPEQSNIKGNVVLCCDHQFDDDITNYCEKSKYTIINPHEIYQYLCYDSESNWKILK